MQGTFRLPHACRKSGWGRCSCSLELGPAVRHAAAHSLRPSHRHGARSAASRAGVPAACTPCRYYLSQTKAPHGSDEALHEKLMLQLMSNSFAIAEAGQGMSHGLGVYPIGAVFNHSSRCGTRPCIPEAFPG